MNKSDFRLIQAAYAGDMGEVKSALHEGADVHAELDLPLRTAVGNNNINTAKMLLEAGADVHALDEAPLIIAINEGYLQMLKVLLEAGADVQTSGVKEALERAAEKGHKATVCLVNNHCKKKTFDLKADDETLFVQMNEIANELQRRCAKFNIVRA